MYCAITESNRVAHITEVNRGKACSCTCIGCGESVIARQGSLREWHFAHESGQAACEISYESFLHRFIKQVILDAGGLKLPPTPAGFELPRIVRDQIHDNWIRFTSIEAEVAIGSVRPDLLGWVCTQRLAIEIAYSSFCDEDKIAELARLGICTLEIDVRQLHPQTFDPDTVRHWVLTQDVAKKWLFGLLPIPVAPPAEPAVDEVPMIRHVLSVIIAGCPVRLKKLRWGQLILSFDYGEEVCRRVRQIAHRFNGRWDPRFKNWRINECWQESLEATLRSGQDPNSFE